MTDLTLSLSDHLKNPFNPLDIRDSLLKFEDCFDDLQISAELNSKALEHVDTKSFAEKDVQELILRIVEENNMELNEKFAEIGVVRENLIEEKKDIEIERDLKLGKVLEKV